jgi:hypothetical protein
MPIVSINLSKDAYTGYMNIPKGQRSRIVSAYLEKYDLDSNSRRMLSYSFTDLAGDEVKIPMGEIRNFEQFLEHVRRLHHVNNELQKILSKGVEEE